MYAAALTEAGITFVRDKVDLGYKGRISEFMEEIGRGRAVVVVICNRYLRSPNTMFELVQIGKCRDVHDRIFPVVLSDARIFSRKLRRHRIDHNLQRAIAHDEFVDEVNSPMRSRR